MAGGPNPSPLGAGVLDHHRLRGWAADGEVLALAERLRQRDREHVPTEMFDGHASLLEAWTHVGLCRRTECQALDLTPAGRAMIVGLSEYLRWQKAAERPEVALLREAGLAPGGIFVDVGCGPGARLLGLLPLGPRAIIGVDPNPILLQLARAIEAIERPRASRAVGAAWILGRAENLPVAAGGADAVLCRNTFHLLTTAQALAEIARVLRPGGAAVIQFHDWAFYARRLADRRLRRLLPDTALALFLGTLLHCTGRQWRLRLGSRCWSEVYHSAGLLARLAAPLRLELLRTIPGHGTTCPMCVLRRAEGRAAALTRSPRSSLGMDTARGGSGRSEARR